MDVSSPLLAPTLAEFKAAILPDLLAAMPQPSASAPPPVALNSAVGSTAPYARADHTHKSSVQRQVIAVVLSGSTGKGIVTFGQPYDPGTTPIVVTESETPDQTGYVNISSVVAGSITNTGFTVMVRRVNATVTLPGLALSLLGFVVNIFGMASGTVNVRYIAAPPTS